MGVTFRYTVLRLGIFVVCLAGAAALGARGLLALGIAAVVSVLLSLVLLRRQREQMASALQQRVEHRVEQRQAPSRDQGKRSALRRGAFQRGVDADNAAEDDER